MSRVSYVMMNPGSEKELTRAVRGCLAKLTAELAKDAGISRDDILEVTLVGNPIMHHLLLGLDPTELGGAPFALTIDEAVRRPATELGLPVHPGARAYVLPCIAGHVGADTAGVILSEAPYLADEVNLIVDIGTNAEIVLGNRDRLVAASSPTGPAFEGAQISCGQRAAPGAIERVRIDPETLEPRYRVIGSELWSDDPAFAGHARHGRVRLGDHRGDRRAPPRGRAHHRRHDRRRARRPFAARRRRRPDVLVRALGRRATPHDHAERRASDPARQGSAPRGLHAALRALRDRARRPDPACRRLRKSHRPRARARPRPRPRLRSRERHLRRQRRRDRSAGSRCSTAPPGRRSRRSCAGWRRSRPPSSRASRSSSSARWRFPTTPTATSASVLSSTCLPGGSPTRPKDARAADAPVPGPIPRKGAPHDRDNRRPPQWWAGRKASRPGRVRRGQRPVHHAHADAVRGALGGAAQPDRGERRHGARAGRDRLPRQPRGAAAVQGCRRRHRRRARALPARSCPAARPGDRSGPVHAGCAEPRAQRRDRREEHRVRAGLRLAVRPRPRQRAPLRDDRGLPQLRQADLPDAVSAPLGRHGLRAGRPARQQAALRDGLRAHALLGQGVHGLGHPSDAGPRTPSRWPGSCSGPTSSNRTP